MSIRVYTLLSFSNSLAVDIDLTLTFIISSRGIYHPDTDFIISSLGIYHPDNDFYHLLTRDISSWHWLLSYPHKGYTVLILSHSICLLGMSHSIYLLGKYHPFVSYHLLRVISIPILPRTLHMADGPQDRASDNFTCSIYKQPLVSTYTGNGVLFTSSYWFAHTQWHGALFTSSYWFAHTQGTGLYSQAAIGSHNHRARGSIHKQLLVSTYTGNGVLFTSSYWFAHTQGTGLYSQAVIGSHIHRDTGLYSQAAIG